MPGSRESKNTATTRKRKVRTFCINYGSPDASLDLSRQLRGFRIHLRKTEASNAVQCRRNITWSHSHTLSSCINLIMHRFWSVTDVMHYENVYCNVRVAIPVIKMLEGEETPDFLEVMPGW